MTQFAACDCLGRARLTKLVIVALLGFRALQNIANVHKRPFYSVIYVDVAYLANVAFGSSSAVTTAKDRAAVLGGRRAKLSILHLQTIRNA